MDKRTTATLVVALLVLVVVLWPGLEQPLPNVLGENVLTRSRVAGILGAAFLGVTALRRSAS